MAAEADRWRRSDAEVTPLDSHVYTPGRIVDPRLLDCLTKLKVMSTVPPARRRVPSPPRRRSHHVRRILPTVDETSAGGVTIDVMDGRAYLAVIARRNRAGRLEWCLPKGHLEGKETAPEAAVREIYEETGIESRVLRHLATIDYWFAGDDRRVHKVVHHFLLEAIGGYLTVDNDPDQEAEDVAWLTLEEAATRLAYPNERRVVSMARDVLVGRA